MCVVRYVTLAVALFFASLPAAAATDLSKLLAGVENRYNKPRTMSFTFEQTYSGGGRMTRSERGELYLQKPGRMRWKYTDPAGKLFVTDGKFAYYYSPSTNQVDKAKPKETDDMRAPLARLGGRRGGQRQASHSKQQSRQSLPPDGDQGEGARQRRGWAALPPLLPPTPPYHVAPGTCSYASCHRVCAVSGPKAILPAVHEKVAALAGRGR